MATIDRPRPPTPWRTCFSMADLPLPPGERAGVRGDSGTLGSVYCRRFFLPFWQTQVAASAWRSDDLALCSPSTVHQFPLLTFTERGSIVAITRAKRSP